MVGTSFERSFGGSGIDAQMVYKSSELLNEVLWQR